MMISIQENVLLDKRLDSTLKLLLGTIFTQSYNNNFKIKITSINVFCSLTEQRSKNALKKLSELSWIDYSIKDGGVIEGKILLDENTKVLSDIKKKEKVDKTKEYENEISDIIDYFNEITGGSIRKSSVGNRRMIVDALSSGTKAQPTTVEDLKLVILYKHSKWKNDDKMRQYIQIPTLFSKQHFENYLNEAKTNKQKLFRQAAAEKRFEKRKTSNSVKGW